MSKTRRIILISLFAAISVALDIFKEMIPFLNMPSGGSINISLIPLVAASFILGIRDGIFTSLIAFMISTMFGLNNIYISIPQYFFDYILPTLILGLSSIFYKNKKILEMEFGILFVMSIRTFSLVISGMYFWFEESVVAGSFEALVGSLAYNVPYSFITLIVLVIIVPLLVKSVSKYLL